MTSTTWNLFWGSGFVKAPLKNGIGRFVPQLQRITFKFCKTNGQSKCVREFIEKDLIDFAKENPGVVVYVKPRRFHSPHAKAEYLTGEIEHMSFHNKTRDDVIKWVEYLRCRSGYPVVRLRKSLHTDHPSIQGIWTPWINHDSSLFNSIYPNEVMSEADKTEETGTDQLLRMHSKWKSSEQ